MYVLGIYLFSNCNFRQQYYHVMPRLQAQFGIDVLKAGTYIYYVSLHLHTYIHTSSQFGSIALLLFLPTYQDVQSTYIQYFHPLSKEAIWYFHYYLPYCICLG